MDPDFWHARWETNQIGFHRDAVNTYLERYWPTLGLAAGCRVLVPLCGKSLDLLWLREQGHAVIGVELSRIAVQAFFEENGASPAIDKEAHCTRWSCEDIELLCGDFFDLEAGDLGRVDAVYDRAALIALTGAQRPRYAQRLADVLQPGTPGLLVTLDYGQEQMDGPPFAVPDNEVRRLFEDNFRIEHLLQFDALEANAKFREKGINSLVEHVYRLERKTTQ